MVAHASRGTVGKVGVAFFVPVLLEVRQVRGRGIVQVDGLGGVFSLVGLSRSAGGNNVGCGTQNLSSGSERKCPVSVGLVVIGNRPRVLGQDQHGLECFHLVLSGHAAQFRWLDRIAISSSGNTLRKQLGQALGCGGCILHA